METILFFYFLNFFNFLIFFFQFFFSGEHLFRWHQFGAILWSHEGLRSEQTREHPVHQGIGQTLGRLTSQKIRYFPFYKKRKIFQMRNWFLRGQDPGDIGLCVTSRSDRYRIRTSYEHDPFPWSQIHDQTICQTFREVSGARSSNDTPLRPRRRGCSADRIVLQVSKKKKLPFS